MLPIILTACVLLPRGAYDDLFSDTGATDTNGPDTDGDTDTDLDTGTDSDADTDTGWPQHPGKAGAVGWISRTDYLGDYWTGGTPDSLAWAWWYLIEPRDIHVWNLLASQTERCAVDFQEDLDLEPLVDPSGWPTTTFDGPAGTITLSLDGDFWAANDLDPDKVTTGADYDISESAAGELPALSVPDAVVVPEPLTLTSPELDGSAPPSLAENALAFTYKGGGSADRIILELRYVEGESSEVIQTISCIETNDGSITVPNGLFSLYSASDHVLVSLMALEEGSSVLDFNQAEFRVAGMHTLVGAFYPDP